MAQGGKRLIPDRRQWRIPDSGRPFPRPCAEGPVSLISRKRGTCRASQIAWPATCTIEGAGSARMRNTYGEELCQ